MKLTEEERKRRSDAMKKINEEHGIEWMREYNEKRWTEEERKRQSEWMMEYNEKRWNDPEEREKTRERMRNRSDIDRVREMIVLYKHWRRLHDAGTEYDDE